MIPQDKCNKYQHYLNEFRLFSINLMVALNCHSFLFKSYRVLFLCANRLESFSAKKILWGGGLEIDHENEKRDPGFQALSFAYGSPRSPCTLSYGPPNFGTRQPRASRVFAGFGSGGSV